MAVQQQQMDWTSSFAARTKADVGGALAAILDLPVPLVVEDPSDALDVIRGLFLAVHDLGDELPRPLELLQLRLVVLGLGGDQQGQHE